MSTEEPQILDFRALLTHELNQRKKKNQGYSSRAFARDLQVAPSYLVGLMKGAKRPTEERAIEMAKALGWGPNQTKVFATLVRHSRAKGDVARQEIFREVERLSVGAQTEWRLSLDKFKVVADWYHFAIVEFLGLEEQDGTVETLSRRLGLALGTARAALRRLELVGLVQLQGEKLIRVFDNYVIEDVPSAAVREHHRQILDRAKLALTQQKLNEREFSSTTLACDPAIMPEIKERIRRFRREIEDLAGQSPHKTAIIELAVQAFRIDRP